MHKREKTLPERKGVRLCNIFLPLWLIIFVPTYLWLILIPVNYLIDRIVLWWSLRDNEKQGYICRRSTWKICLAGFFSDFVGILPFLGLFVASALMEADSPARDWLDPLLEGVGFNPFMNLPSFLIVAACVFLASRLIYRLDRWILRREGLNTEQANKSARTLALFTAPYLYFFPMSILFDLGILSF